ncbi:MAG: hypothetical protein HKN09_07565, partial [Saprospiraceae bacterium]|nr:hypothetical protein [Saprospiraceae bacterium]
MDLNNVSTLIKKINRLYDIINSIGEASDTEKDLLKAYVLDLYEAVTMEPEDQSEDLEIEEMLKKLKKQKKAEKKLKKQLNKAVEQLEDMSVSEQAEEAQEEAQAAQEVEESPQASHEEPAQEESA